MFFYSECKIISAAPLAEIEAYLREIGETGLLIEITPQINPISLDIPLHEIRVHGDRALAERFLTDFRFRFLSAGG